MIIECKTCKKKFRIIPYRKRTAKFCSRKCIRLSKKTRILLSKLRKGVPKSDTHRKNISLSKMSAGNPMWKGERAGLDAIHIWVLARKPKPKFCVICKKNKPKDLANISQKYKRDVDDFEWLCRKCHMVKDGRINRLLKGLNT